MPRRLCALQKQMIDARTCVRTGSARLEETSLFIFRAHFFGSVPFGDNGCCIIERMAAWNGREGPWMPAFRIIAVAKRQ